MAEKLNDFASRLAKGSPKGLGLGVKVLLGASAAAYGFYRSLFTGNKKKDKEKVENYFLLVVEGGHRAIIFNRIGGIDQHTIHSEGLHFR
jgi:prohibitin 2